MFPEVILFCATLAGVLAGCLLPNAWLPPLPNDKFLHFAAFAVLTLLAARIVPVGLPFAAALAGLLLLGWLIECLQNRVPGRAFSWPDQAANAAGIAAAALLVWLLA